MRKKIVIGCILVLTRAGFVLALEDLGQRTEPLTKSMGQPSRHTFYLGPMLALDRHDDDEWGGHLHGGIHRHLLNPIYGIGVAGEGYLGGIDGELDSGLRLLGVFEFLFLRAGLDHSFRESDTDGIFSLALPLRRGGPLGRGGHLRIDWIPGRNDSFNIGLSFPLGNPYAGKTRPINDQVDLPEPNIEIAPSEEVLPSSELESTLVEVRRAAEWIKRFTTPFFDQKTLGDDPAALLGKLRLMKEHMNLKDDLLPKGHTFNAEILAYHRALERAFSLAAGANDLSNKDPQERMRIADKARDILLQEIIIPYNRLIGLTKEDDSLLGYGAPALWHLDNWLKAERSVSREQHQCILYVFESLIDIMEEIRRGSKEVWGESSLVWMPLQYGLQPHQHDKQQELNRIIEQVVGNPFATGNQVHYVINEQFQRELREMVHLAEDYHVLWIHDYRGFTPQGTVDRIGFQQTLAYLAALTNGVRQYDSTGKMPLYVIMIDQHFYEANRGHLWLDLLENPLDREIQLPPGYGDMEDEIRKAQEELRASVSASALLQAKTRRFGKAWLVNKIKVHVNVTNPSDWSFRSSHLIPNLPFVPDNLMRDHRKIAFYDVTERDPGKGEALYSGMGVGEHYAGPTWEDRAILVQGPALVTLKDAVRQVLLNQGFKESEIPVPLRRQTKPPNYAEMVRGLESQGWTATVMDIHNQTGFRAKPINALKATLYSLMPAGSTIIVPDSLWNSPFWGGMLVGAALRGCRVLVVAPSLENAPSAGFPQMSRAYELFARLAVIRDYLQEELEAQGGMLKVGVYTRNSDVSNISEKLRESAEGLRRYPFLKEVFPFDDDVYTVLQEFPDELDAYGIEPSYYTEDMEKRKPKLHLKTNFFASGQLRELLSWQGWDEILDFYLRHRTNLTAREAGDVDVKDIPEELREAAEGLLESYSASLSEEEKDRVIYYLIVGSQNQDYRGMIMDGEVACVVAGHHSLVAIVDLFFMMSLTTWVEDIETLDKVLPPYTGWKRWIGRYIMKAL